MTVWTNDAKVEIAFTCLYFIALLLNVFNVKRHGLKSGYTVLLFVPLRELPFSNKSDI
jgi:hypothetical protein